MFRYSYMVVSVSNKQEGEVIIETELFSNIKLNNTDAINEARNYIASINNFKKVTIVNIQYLGKEFIGFKALFKKLLGGE